MQVICPPAEFVSNLLVVFSKVDAANLVVDVFYSLFGFVTFSVQHFHQLNITSRLPVNLHILVKDISFILIMHTCIMTVLSINSSN